jgi:lysyl-tRNA synthetase, class I
MDWADELAASVSGPQVVNDSKTPSGTVHVGSLRGPVIVDVIWRAVRARGLEAQFLYGVEDLDAMDNQALLSGDAVERYMGVPLNRVPDQFGDCHDSYARHFMADFLGTFHGLGIHPELYWMSDLYAAGAMDRFVRLALERADRVREIYRRVSHVDKPSAWLPVQPICENCGRVGTTIATDWDGETVRYECRTDLVDWARGCGNAGRIAPLGGRATLPWNLEWAAQWGHFGVTIEPCGKDLSTAGGSRDRSDAIGREVFEREPPLNVPYEFVNVGGKKMSTSRGRGAAAHQIAQVVPPEQLRFLFLRPRPNSVIEFEPDGTDAIPRLFDEFDRVADATAGRPVKGSLPPSPERVFAYSVLTTDPAEIATRAAAFRLPFGHVAFLVQQPAVDLAAAAAGEKGAPLSSLESAILAERDTAARRWLETYAPESARIQVRRGGLPAEAAELDVAQRAFLAALAEMVGAPDAPAAGDGWQARIFDSAKATGLPAGRAFAAIYLAFLGRSSGPRAGWLVASLEPAFVLSRLREGAGLQPTTTSGGPR